MNCVRIALVACFLSGAATSCDGDRSCNSKSQTVPEAEKESRLSAPSLKKVCRQDSDCAIRSECSVTRCDNGLCVIANRPAQTACSTDPTPNDCDAPACDGFGNCLPALAIRSLDHGCQHQPNDSTLCCDTPAWDRTMTDRIDRVLDKWLAARNARSLVLYSEFYAPDYRGHSEIHSTLYDRNRWLKATAAMFHQPGHASLSRVRITLEPPSQARIRAVEATTVGPFAEVRELDITIGTDLLIHTARLSSPVVLPIACAPTIDCGNDKGSAMIAACSQGCALGVAEHCQLAARIYREGLCGTTVALSKSKQMLASFCQLHPAKGLRDSAFASCP